MVGLLMAFGLLIFYAIILTIFNDGRHVIDEIKKWWPWILPLVAGFGLQEGLFHFIRVARREILSAAVVTRSGGVSAAAMVACCFHHLTDVIPLMGLTVVSLIIAAYQPVLFLIGILANVIVIVTLLSIIQKEQLTRGWLGQKLPSNLTLVRKGIIGLSIIAVVVVFLAISFNRSNERESDFLAPSESNLLKSAERLSEVSSESEGITIVVKPIELQAGQSLRFELTMDTHEGSLNTDLPAAVSLVGIQGEKYPAVSWDGPPPGGHHRSGILTFSALDVLPAQLTMVIADDDWSAPREFAWDLE